MKIAWGLDANSQMKNALNLHATKCQNASAMIATNFLLGKYLRKFDQQLKTHIFSIWKSYYVMPLLGRVKFASSVVKYQHISQRISFNRHCLENLPNICTIANEKRTRHLHFALGCKFSTYMIFSSLGVHNYINKYCLVEYSKLQEFNNLYPFQ